MQVKSIAECSKWSILQYFRPSLSYHLSLRSLFCLLLSGHFTPTLLFTVVNTRITLKSDCSKHPFKVREKANIRNRCITHVQECHLKNQVPRLTQDTIWESDKSKRKYHTQKSQAVSPFPTGDHNKQTSQKAKTYKKIHKRSTGLERSVIK